MDDIKKWVNQGTLRAVVIEPHVHGVRVTIKEGFGYDTSVTSVAGTIQEGFKVCLTILPQAQMNWNKQEIERTQKEIYNKESELKAMMDKLNTLKEELSKNKDDSPEDTCPQCETPMKTVMGDRADLSYGEIKECPYCGYRN